MLLKRLYAFLSRPSITHWRKMEEVGEVGCTDAVVATKRSYEGPGVDKKAFRFAGGTWILSSLLELQVNLAANEVGRIVEGETGLDFGSITK